MRFESAYVAEFVAHHALIGVDKFVILNDNLDQREESELFKENLQQFVDLSVVEVIFEAFHCDVVFNAYAKLFDEQLNKIPIELSAKEIRRIGGVEKTQFIFFTQCARYLAQQGFDWVLLIDADEFVLPTRSSSSFCVKDTLRTFGVRFSHANALLMLRRTFTYSDEMWFDRRANELVMKRFDRSVPTNKVKSIVRASTSLLCASAHQCTFADTDTNGRYVARLSNGAEVVGRELTTNDTAENNDDIFLAHYRSKSIEECLFKVARGYRWMGDKEIDFCAQGNAKKDVSAKPFANQVAELFVQSKD